MTLADIILIEDNHQDIEMIIDSFNEIDTNPVVLAFNDGAKALSYFFNAQECPITSASRMPKLILLDLKLPKINGLEVLKHLKSDDRTKLIPVAVFSSSNEFSDKLQAYSLGANSYIVKPLDADEFYRLVAEIGSYWLSANTAIHDDA